MRKLAVLFVLLLGFVGCYKLETTELKEERGTVVFKRFVQAHDDYQYDYDPSEGDWRWRWVTIPDEWTVQFGCRHGGFALQGSGNSNACRMYHALQEGKSVWIYYTEVLRVRERDGKITKEHHGFNFVDASHTRRAAEGQE